MLQLLGAYRNAEGQPRQRVIVSLGNADIPKKDHLLIAEMVERRLYGYRDLFEHRLSKRVQQWVDSIVKRIDLGGRWRPLLQRGKTSNPSETLQEDDVVDGVFINHVGHTDTSSLGPSLLGLHVWKQLGMPELLQQVGFNPAQHAAAAANVINRLVEPVSEHALVEWIPTSALPELLGARLAASGRDRFYRVSDKLLEHQDRIEKHLRTLQKRLLNLDRTILLYDLTNFYFEGTARANPKAHRGRSKEKRNDCPQVVVGMVFDREGFELAHRIFEGNRNDSKTLVEMVEVLQAIVQEEGELQLSAKPLVIVDAGVATKKNLKKLRECHFDYLVNDTRRSRSKYQAEFSKGEGFETLSCKDKKTHVEVKRIQDPQSTFVEGGKEVRDWLILCKSEARREKETAILSKAEERLRADLGKLAKRVEEGRLTDPEKIQRAIGRLQCAHFRAHRFYTIKLEKVSEDRANKVRHKVVWYRDDEKHEDNGELLGCYVLRTSRDDLSAQELWHLYITLTRAEDGFRELKSNLGLRPVHHQKEWRVDAHVFITVLAYHLQHFILHTLRSLGDTRSWSTLKRVLETHSYDTVIVPTNCGEVYRIRKAGIPGEAQKEIYRNFGIEWQELPKTKTVIRQKTTATL